MFVCHPNLLANQQCIQLIGSALYQNVADSDSSPLLLGLKEGEEKRKRQGRGSRGLPVIRAPQNVKMSVDRKDEDVWYQIVTWGRKMLRQICGRVHIRHLKGCTIYYMSFCHDIK